MSEEKLLSAASKRAIERGYDKGSSEWFCEFKIHDLGGDFAFEEGVIRRDPSAVLFVDGFYHCWYTKGEGETAGFGSDNPDDKVFPWDKTQVWHATSKDGWDWKEEGPAITQGPAGAYDDRACFTPEVLEHEGKFILVYQTVQAPYLNRTIEQIGMAIADNPYGPWRKLDAPILSPATNGVWKGDEDNRFIVEEKGDFDSHKTHDPCLLFFNNKFYLYYKGETMGEEMTMGGREIKWGVAISDKLEGPYVKSPYNPITNSGHEVCCWNYKNGIAAMLITDGVEKNTIQFAEDGVNFEIMSHIKSGPEAAGLVKNLDADKAPLAGLDWGVCHQYDETWNWNYIRRFERHIPWSEVGEYHC
ncbi:MAG: hypothetical protein NWR76_09115 [Opitutales bacterium]|jgi:hypothetical protein|nr:hypothetical protein [Opitutales bacterium]MDP4883402.1 hypothetical protein [Opitutales bacterium]MDP5079686.1 hypothetical protein [Opitutales bacterium]